MKSGAVLLDKPAEYTSFDCIQKLKKILNRKDLGHAGTLDRFATGLLPIFFGEGLKLARFFQEPHPKLSSYWKTYQGTLVLGQTTDTLDPSGKITEQIPISETNRALFSLEKLQEKANSFLNRDYVQTPPAYSAKKIQGKRASDLTRAGELVELKPSTVYLRKFSCLQIQEGENQTLELQFEVECSKGTYIRALARDFAQELNQVSYLKTLLRTQVGDFTIKQAHQLETITANPESFLLTLEECCQFLPQREIYKDEVEDFKKGSFQKLLQRIKSENLDSNVYCFNFEKKAMCLIEIETNNHIKFLRGFQQ